MTFEEYTRHIDWSLTVGRRRTHQTARQAASTTRQLEGAQALLEAEDAVDDPLRIVVLGNSICCNLRRYLTVALLVGLRGVDWVGVSAEPPSTGPAHDDGAQRQGADGRSAHAAPRIMIRRLLHPLCPAADISGPPGLDKSPESGDGLSPSQW